MQAGEFSSTRCSDTLDIVDAAVRTLPGKPTPLSLLSGNLEVLLFPETMDPLEVPSRRTSSANKRNVCSLIPTADKPRDPSPLPEGQIRLTQRTYNLLCIMVLLNRESFPAQLSGCWILSYFLDQFSRRGSSEHAN